MSRQSKATGEGFDALKFYRDFPVGGPRDQQGDTWLQICLEEMCAAAIKASRSETACKAVSGCRGSGEHAEQIFTCEECGDVTESMQCPRGRSTALEVKQADAVPAVHQGHETEASSLSAPETPRSAACGGKGPAHTACGRDQDHAGLTSFALPTAPLNSDSLKAMLDFVENGIRTNGENASDWKSDMESIRDVLATTISASAASATEEKP